MFNSCHPGPRRVWKGGSELPLMTPDPRNPQDPGERRERRENFKWLVFEQRSITFGYFGDPKTAPKLVFDQHSGPSQAGAQAGPGPKLGPGSCRARAQAGPRPKLGPAQAAPGPKLGSSRARTRAELRLKPGPVPSRPRPKPGLAPSRAWASGRPPGSREKGKRNPENEGKKLRSSAQV